jgi:hypothetical protein
MDGFRLSIPTTLPKTLNYSIVKLGVGVIGRIFTDGCGLLKGVGGKPLSEIEGASGLFDGSARPSTALRGKTTAG